MGVDNPSTPPPATPLSNATTNTSDITTLTIEKRSCPLAPLRMAKFCRRKKNKANIVSLRSFKFDDK